MIKSLYIKIYQYTHRGIGITYYERGIKMSEIITNNINVLIVIFIMIYTLYLGEHAYN